jgi:hydrogenase maturation protein HypF
MQRLFHVSPKILAYDLHPRYLSTQLAMRMPAEKRIGVQHHHAHIAGCMAEHGLEGPVIGIAWDGTGFGTDGTIWGGEFLVTDFAAFERVAHLRPILLVGGDAAVREPWRIARAYLRDAFDNDVPTSVAFNGSVDDDSIRTVDAMLQRRIQVVETSSCGRLFDAVASLLGIHPMVSFEGQAAMALEAVAADHVSEAYEVVISEADSGKAAQVDTRPMIRQIIHDLKTGVSAAMISARFHQTVIGAAVDVCKQIRSQRGLHRVCLSGGCFQNIRLLQGSVDRLRAEGFEVYYPRRVPANDGGISFGQAAIACELVRRGA